MIITYRIQNGIFRERRDGFASVNSNVINDCFGQIAIEDDVKIFNGDKVIWYTYELPTDTRIKRSRK